MPRNSTRSTKRDVVQKESILQDGHPRAKTPKLTTTNTKMSWRNCGRETTDSKGLSPLLIYDGEETIKNASIAGFDLDGTIITTKSGKRFPTGPADWKFCFDQVPKRLRSLYENHTKVVFFTNQAGLEKKKTKPSDIKEKIEAIIEQIGIPVTVLVCTGHNQFRKPSILLWEYFLEHCNRGKLDISQSVFVGDAAGRIKDWRPGAKKDFSCSDRMFAANIGVSFYTPEEYFLGERATTNFEWGVPNPKDILAKSNVFDASSLFSPLPKQELVIFVGPPASGKSTFVKRYMSDRGYTHVNRDTLGSMPKCVKTVEAALLRGESVVVDNTNPTVLSRASFIAIAKKHNMGTPRQLLTHLNFFRAIVTQGRVRRIPAVAFHTYYKKFEEPSTKEGFASVSEIEFVPSFSVSNEFDGVDAARAKMLFSHWQSD
eukprot:gene3465-8297_t